MLNLVVVCFVVRQVSHSLGCVLQEQTHISGQKDLPLAGSGVGSPSLRKPDKQTGSLRDKSFVPHPIVLTHCVMGYVCEVPAFDEVP